MSSDFIKHDCINQTQRERQAGTPASNINKGHIGEEMDYLEVIERTFCHPDSNIQTLADPAPQFDPSFDSNNVEEPSTPVFMNLDAPIANFEEVSTTQDDEVVIISQEEILSSEMMNHGNEQKPTQTAIQYNHQTKQRTVRDVVLERLGWTSPQMLMNTGLAPRIGNSQPRLQEQPVKVDRVVKQRSIGAHKRNIPRSGDVANATTFTDTVKKALILKAASIRPHQILPRVNPREDQIQRRQTINSVRKPQMQKLAPIRPRNGCKTTSQVNIRNNLYLRLRLQRHLNLRRAFTTVEKILIPASPTPKRKPPPPFVRFPLNIVPSAKPR